MRRNTETSYGSIARTLHWLTALVILANIVLGLVAVRLPMEALDAKVQAFSMHKTLGIAAFAIGIVRILWALSQPKPVPVHAGRPFETRLAEIMHWVLYAALVLVPLTGWIEHAATDGFAPILWPLGQDLPLVPKSPLVASVMASVHHAFAWVLIGAVVLHVAGALKHAVIDRDGVLARMLLGRPAGRGRNHGQLAPALVAVAVFVAGTGFAIATRPADEAQPMLAEAVSEWRVTEGELGFSVMQMGSEVQGGFSDWTAAIRFDPDSGTGDVEVTINMSSVTVGMVTDQARGAQFFDVENNPTAIFRGAIRPEGDGFVAEGPLSLKGHEASVTLPFALQIEDGVASMSGETVMDRRDWAIGQDYDDESSVGFAVALAVRLQAER